jgi:hypothetical protein
MLRFHGTAVTYRRTSRRGGFTYATQMTGRTTIDSGNGPERATFADRCAFLVRKGSGMARLTR